MVIDDLNLIGIAGMPPKDDSPLIVDPNGIQTLPFALQRFQSIPWRFAKVTNLRRIVQIEQLSPSCPYQLMWKTQDGFCSAIIEQVFRKSIRKRLNHRTMLSNLDNTMQEEDYNFLPSGRHLNQHAFSQSQIAHQHTLAAQRLHDRPDDNRTGGNDFLAILL